MQADSINAVSLPAVHDALLRCCAAMHTALPELNALDAQMGDGDLGTTLGRCAQNVGEVLVTSPPSLDLLFKGCAQACARASGSSFGTLLAVAFLDASKTVGSTTSLDRDALVHLLDHLGRALSQRGGANLGDKTMLDSLEAVARALQSTDDVSPAGLAAAARNASDQALAEFRDRPNRIGRARMFAERSVGLDDPGMVAIQRMVHAL